MRLTRTTEPATPVLTVQEVKDFLRITQADEDTYLANMVIAATNICEKYLQRSLITQTWTKYLDNYPSYTPMKLAYGPVQSITSIKTYDYVGNTTTFSTAKYYLSDLEQEGMATLISGEAWDDAVLRPRDGVEVIFIAGYGDASTDIPYSIIQGMLHAIAHMYENREVADMQIPEVVKQLWNPYKVYIF